MSLWIHTPIPSTHGGASPGMGMQYSSASHSAAALSGYRAGLLASIAAACMAAYTVALASPGGVR